MELKFLLTRQRKSNFSNWYLRVYISGHIDCPNIVHEGGDAYYNPFNDYINMPEKESLKEMCAIYSVLFYEIIHRACEQIGEILEKPN